jgi:lysophospholipase L1-like esterase
VCELHRRVEDGVLGEGDGLHFNAVGYTLVAREIAKVAAEEFGLSPRTFETEI